MVNLAIYKDCMINPTVYWDYGTTHMYFKICPFIGIVYLIHLTVKTKEIHMVILARYWDDCVLL